jgi:hypothetical protein
LYESPDKTYIIFNNIHDIYNSDDLKNAIIIGQSTAIINKILKEHFGCSFLLLIKYK